jgi:hypothetical protein
MRIRSLLFAGILAATLGIQGAYAQGPVVGSTADVAVSVARAKVTHVDAKNRVLTLRGPAGNTFEVTAGPEVRNFAQIKAGDEIVLHFTEAVAVVITKPGTKLPDIAVTDTAARATPGQKPAGAVARQVTVTGVIVGLDPTRHIISVVDQHGGPVREISVQDPERQAAMKALQVGDMITVVFTEAVAVAVEPAKPAGERKS